MGRFWCCNWQGRAAAHLKQQQVATMGLPTSASAAMGHRQQQQEQVLRHGVAALQMRRTYPA
jgi:hypothetical protein